MPHNQMAVIACRQRFSKEQYILKRNKQTIQLKLKKALGLLMKLMK
jgi:hypothetical protein